MTENQAPHDPKADPTTHTHRFPPQPQRFAPQLILQISESKYRGTY
ncbi:hypothetical protein NDI49_27075 [Trichocoleus sp. ST-U3]